VICVVDASVAVKWFVAGNWALREDHIDNALLLLHAAAQGSVHLLEPPHFMAEVAAVLARLKGDAALQDIDNLSALDITWAEPAQAVRHAVHLAIDLNHHVFDTLYHALALGTPGATLVTADRRHFDKCRHLGQVTWLPDWRLG
jgi:predicted nucleic acid-binding protein